LRADDVARNRFLDRLKRAGWRHWTVVALVLAITVPLTPAVDRLLGLDQVQCWIFQQLGEIAPRPLEPRYTRLIMIGDAEYYGEELRHRRPIRRDYLAKLVDALAAADASVIALDFDLRMPNPGRGSAPGDYDALRSDYRSEVDALVRAVARAAERRKVVLPKRIAQSADGGYRLSPDVYSPYGICTRLTADGRWDNPGTPEFPLSAQAKANISCGYIALPRDRCQIAPCLDVGHEGKIDSFALALARAHDPGIAGQVGETPYFGTYLRGSVLDDPRIAVSARALLARDPAALAVVRFKPIIVGARWHTDAHGVGKFVDLHWTPVGWINGTMIHQSYAEAILDGRLYALVPHWMRYIFEVLYALVLAAVLAAYTATQARWAIFAGFVVALPLAQWLLLQLAGVDFQALPALLGLFLHSLFEQPVDAGVGRAVQAWRSLTRRLR
jgi:CHASE2 domain-containing sensor protein